MKIYVNGEHVEFIDKSGFGSMRIRKGIIKKMYIDKFLGFIPLDVYYYIESDDYVYKVLERDICGVIKEEITND